MINKRESKLLAVIITILTAAAVLAGSIAVPILWRPFYYAHIEPLNISLRTGLTETQIKETYNEVMAYCLGRTDTFQLTHLSWSADGASHFADVRVLFLLDLKIAIVSVVLLGLLWAMGRHYGVKPARLKGHTCGFWSAVGLGGCFAVLGGLAALDFDRAFTVFHAVFFPGKENWIFDYRVDPVINMLPQVFFRNCAILVLILIIVCCITLILVDCNGVRRKR